MKALWLVGYFSAVLVLLWLCDVAPIVGYPLAFIFVLRLLFRGRKRPGEELDGEMREDSFSSHHHHH
jgi:hypothetical protein